MNLFKYSFKNLSIYKTRSIIMIVTMVFVITASVIGISIQKSVNQVSDKYRKEIGAKVNIEVDYDKTTKSGYAPKAITPKQYDAISKLSIVKKYSYLTEIMLGSKQIKAVGEDTQEKEDQMGIVSQDENGKPIQLKTPKLKLIGGGGNAELPEFQNGSRKIIDGKPLKNDYEVLISSELAKLNNLKVGDTLRLNDVDEKKEKTFKIVGIYEDKTTADGGSGVDMPIFNRRNEVITNFTSAMSLDSGGFGQVRATYELNDPKDFDEFNKEVRNLGISDDYTISIDKDSFDKAVGPINNLGRTASYFITIILVIALAIIVLLSVLSARERQYEIGVLRAMGMKKNKVAINFINESCMMLLISLIIGFGIGSVLTKPVANSLLNQQITEMNREKANEKNSSQTNMFAPDRSLDIKTVDKIEIKANYTVLIQIAGISFVMIIFSNMINIVYIMRFQPMQIMRSKN